MASPNENKQAVERKAWLHKRHLELTKTLNESRQGILSIGDELAKSRFSDDIIDKMLANQLRLIDKQDKDDDEYQLVNFELNGETIVEDLNQKIKKVIEKLKKNSDSKESAELYSSTEEHLEKYILLAYKTKQINSAKKLLLILNQLTQYRPKE